MRNVFIISTIVFTQSLFAQELCSWESGTFTTLSVLDRSLLMQSLQSKMEPKFTFSIGDIKLTSRHFFGAIPPTPKELKNKAVQQRKFSAESLYLNPPITVLPEKFDWSDQGKVTSIKCQWGNDCWAFASCAAMESALMISMGSSVPPNLSEQQTIDCSGAGTFANGGWWGPVFDYYLTNGITDESSFPYAHADTVCFATSGPHYYVRNWSYIAPDGGDSTVDQIKTAIINHGPVVAGIYATSLFEHYTNGVFNEFTNFTGDINHAIVIIGWDNTKNAWHLKNSWGQCDACWGWGQNHFGWVAYGANRIGYGAAWVEMKKP